MRKLVQIWFLIALLLVFPPLSRAVIPAILLAEGVELILADTSVVALASSTGAGISAGWTAALTGLGAVAGYLALKDSATNAVRIPMSLAVPAPAAAGSMAASLSSVYQLSGAGSYASESAACNAWLSTSYQPLCTSVGIGPCTVRVTGSGSAGTCQGVRGDSTDGGYENWNTATTYACPAGYSLSGSTCNLSSARTASPDRKCDVSRSGTTYTYYSDDPDCSISGNIHGTVGGSGSTLEIAGVDTYGNPVRTVVTAEANGATTIQQQVQILDASGNSTLHTKTASFDSSGNLTGQSFSSSLASLTQASGQTATVTAAPSGSVGGSAPSTVTFPNDYNREATQQTIKTDVEQLHTDLTATTTAPSDPTPATTSDVQSYLSISGLTSLAAWAVPSHTSTCPVIAFDALGASHVIDAHCAIFTDHFPALSSALILGYVLFALFIVLGA